MNKTLILSAVAAVLLVGSIVYFGNFQVQKTTSQIAAPPVAEKQANVIAAPGVVEAVSEEIEVGAEIAGKLKQVAVEEGERVAKGQTIAVLENSYFQVQIQTAKAAIATLRSQQNTARARLTEAQAERSKLVNGARLEERREARAGFEQTEPAVQNARLEVERRQKLFASGDVSREEMNRATRDLAIAEKRQTELRERFNVVNAPPRIDDLQRTDAGIEIIKRQINEFDAQISEAETRVNQAQANLSKTIVRAPISGVILRKRLKTGESVGTESGTNSIVTIADTSKLRVRLDVDEVDVGKIRAGQTVYVTADAFGNQKFTGKISRVGQTMGRKNFRTERPTEKVDTRILEVLVDLDDGQKLPLGLRVDGFVSSEE